jgi:hypothetical protein
MITIISDQQIRQVATDVNIRMRHHAPAVQRVADILKHCILSNPTLTIEAMRNGERYGYCYKINTPSGRRFYITYDHKNEVIFIKDKMRDYHVIHKFDNDDSEMDVVAAIRGVLI